MLTQVAAVREVLALHVETRLQVDPMDIWALPAYERPIICSSCRVEYPCPTTRTLAKPYADRPGYAEVAG